MLVVRVADDYGGDATGRFFARVYKVGDKMAWYSKAEPRYSEWREECYDIVDLAEQDAAEERCDAICPICKAALDILMRFEELVIVGPVSVVVSSEILP